MKQRERATLGWKKVHEALLKKPFSELLEQIVPVRSCLRCGYGSFVGSSLLCWYCELHEMKRHYTESWRGRLNKLASRIFERCIFGRRAAMTFLVNRGYSSLILTVLALRQHEMRHFRDPWWIMNKRQECSIACNCPQQSRKEGGSPMRQKKKRKKTESIQEKKFLIARKKALRNVENKRRGFPMVCVTHSNVQEASIEDVCHRLQAKRQPLDAKYREPPSANQAWKNRWKQRRANERRQACWYVNQQSLKSKYFEPLALTLRPRFWMNWASFSCWRAQTIKLGAQTKMIGPLKDSSFKMKLFPWYLFSPWSNRSRILKTPVVRSHHLRTLSG